jgi:hypothetical protein
LRGGGRNSVFATMANRVGQALFHGRETLFQLGGLAELQT